MGMNNNPWLPSSSPCSPQTEVSEEGYYDETGMDSINLEAIDI